MLCCLHIDYDIPFHELAILLHKGINDNSQARLKSASDNLIESTVRFNNTQFIERDYHTGFAPILQYSPYI